MLFATGRPVRWLDVIARPAGRAPDGDRQQRRGRSTTWARGRWSTGSDHRSRRRPGRGASRSAPRCRTPASPSSRAPGSATSPRTGTWPADRRRRPGAVHRPGRGDRVRRGVRQDAGAESSARAGRAAGARCSALVGDTLTATHSAAARVRAGRDQRARGEQGDHAGPLLRAARHRRGPRLPPSGTCRMMSPCSAGPGCRTWSPTPTPRCWRWTSRSCRATPTPASGETILGWLDTEPS